MTSTKSITAQLVTEWRRIHRVESPWGRSGPRITPELRQLLDRLAGLRGAAGRVEEDAS